MERSRNATNGEIPQHGYYPFEDEQVFFNSNFDSGNLAKVEFQGNSTYHLWTGPDCSGTSCENTCRTWFYFQIETPPSNNLTLTIKNMNLQGKLFREGMRPVFKTPHEAWKRLENPVSWNVAGEVCSFFELTFSFTFSEGSAYFAFTYPWSYTENLNLTKEIEYICYLNNIYFHNEILTYSLEHRRCDLLTITSKTGILEEKEADLTGLYPDSPERPHKFLKRPVCFITSRVHPGETPGSHVMNGFLRFLTSEDPRAVELREEFVFKIVPMINPDGVFRGYYRTDTNGLNLNRFYNSPVQNLHPTIWAIKQAFLYYHESYSVYCYIDLHAHASKRACFMYGNYMDFPNQIETMLLAKLISLNCANFDFEGSNFSEKNMFTKDKRDGLSKEGSGRVALFKAVNLVRCYTLECNYHSGGVLNKLLPSGLPEPSEADTSSVVYASGIPVYTQEIFEDVGRGICLALLDSILKNPYSRILMTDPDLRNLRYQVGTHISTLVPFRFDRSLKRAIKNQEDFEEFVKSGGKTNKRVYEKKKEEVKIVKRKAPVRPARHEKTVGKKTPLVPPANNNSKSSLEEKSKQVEVVPVKNFVFLKPTPENMESSKKHLQPLTSLNRARKKNDSHSRNISIPPRARAIDPLD